MILWLCLCVLLVARAASGVSQDMWIWGLDAGRFLPPWIAWLSWTIAALVAVPPLGRRLVQAFANGRARIPERAFIATLATAIALLVLLLPDRSWFVSDFILRLGTVRGSIPAETLFPQSPPLDLFLHVTLPRALAGWFSTDVLLVERALGAAKAAAMAILAIRFASLLDVRPVVRAAVGVAIASGGWLALFTGYGKATGDLCVVVAAVGFFGLKLSRGAGGAAWLALAGAAGLLLHRSALALVPALVVAGALGWRAWLRSTGGHHLRGMIWFGVPLLVLAALTPRVAGLITGLDRPHLLPGDRGMTGVLAAAFAPFHLLDLANVILMLFPLAFAIPFLLAAGAGRSGNRVDAAFLGALASPWILGMLFVHPFDQGAFRDWDTFAAAGVALSLVFAWVVAEGLRPAPARAWVAVACAMTTLVFTTQRLLLDRDVEAALARVEAYVSGPPVPADAHRTLALDYLGARYGELDRRDEAARAYVRAAAITPNPRMLYNWALAEADRGEFSQAKAILGRLLATGPETPQALYTLAAVSYLASDYDGARRAVERSLVLAPNEPQSRELLQRIDRAVAAERDGEGR